VDSAMPFAPAGFALHSGQCQHYRGKASGGISLTKTQCGKSILAAATTLSRHT
jgi:hypothetical protein